MPLRGMVATLAAVALLAILTAEDPLGLSLGPAGWLAEAGPAQTLPRPEDPWLAAQGQPMAPDGSLCCHDRPPRPTLPSGPAVPPETAPVPSSCTDPYASLGPPTVAPGGRVSLYASGFAPGSRVSVEIVGPSPSSAGTVEAGPGCDINILITIGPNDLSGSYQVRAIGPGYRAGRTQTWNPSFTVLGAEPTAATPTPTATATATATATPTATRALVPMATAIASPAVEPVRPPPAAPAVRPAEAQEPPCEEEQEAFDQVRLRRLAALHSLETLRTIKQALVEADIDLRERTVVGLLIDLASVTPSWPLTPHVAEALFRGAAERLSNDLLRAGIKSVEVQLAKDPLLPSLIEHLGKVEVYEGLTSDVTAEGIKGLVGRALGQSVANSVGLAWDFWKLRRSIIQGMDALEASGQLIRMVNDYIDDMFRRELRARDVLEDARFALGICQQRAASGLPPDPESRRTSYFWQSVEQYLASDE